MGRWRAKSKLIIIRYLLSVCERIAPLTVPLYERKLLSAKE